MLKVGRDITAKYRWEQRAPGYIDEIDSAYHRHRLEVIKSLLPPLLTRNVVDFGCGEGAMIGIAKETGAYKIHGIDINASLVERAREKYPYASYTVGGVDELRHVERCDCLIAANVLAYLTDEEEAVFYEQAARLGGWLVVTHSNNLFDLFTFNAYTVDFCKTHFGFDVTPLITNPTKPNRTSFNIRENPLSYPDKLAKHGFRVQQVAYINYHAQPPLISGEEPDDMQRPRKDTLPWEEGKWKQMFQCSTFAVRAQKI